ncbi:MAG: hypothetical protein HQK56_19090, partial [Deltaproteobacteria bacterium]|nr:hypothetical protein [Deltaproteobacteria bacterium]
MIVASDALVPFLKKYGKNMFPGVPVILAWNEDRTPLDKTPPEFIVAPGTIEIERHIQIILQTRPSAKKIYI